ncbi:nitrate reductase [NADH]-like protein [Glomus cerebriforme]|uniref:Nitrate reductase n=1 Tax=Glomus cerebriforme TaxID=658196 RepID=A0A397T2K2_9GLOM|nr:nitrate reductase [NADH]-like protein [Glomus cerebriforme]
MAFVERQPAENLSQHFPKEKISSIILPQQHHHNEQQKQQQSIKEQIRNDLESKDVIVTIDPRDVGTPDNWIPRHPELIRLTGKHPFNSESPLPILMEQGFMTPTPLHYVRNHGPVPKLSWDTHRLVVDGFVSKTLNLSMDDIVKMPYREFPVTLICAGNRRKEQNMIKQTIGFNWGSSAISTSVWRGVPLRHVLKLAGCSLDIDYEEPRYVCFVGSDKLPNGYYGTSLTLEWAMEDARDVLLAYKMNGERLTPDHGFPLRVIIPGVIGGRMVKWLSKITVTNKESDSYYHYHDNRVLPPNVDAERANKEKLWYIPDYLINELNINSVISSPAHDEHISISSFVSNTEYTLKGYAYSGGGRKVIRVEISMDNGKTWLLTNLDHPEITHPEVLKRSHNPIRRYWCWCFWSLNVPLHTFIGCSEIRVRAYDSSNNTQPENPTWNVMGMMNNCHFKVKISTVIKGKEVALRFEHPTQAGNNPGGWMVKKEEPAKDAVKKPVVNGTSKGLITMKQVEKRDNEQECWIVIEKKVYDCTKFLKDHPGGADSILINAGMDCTDEFNAIHSDKAKNMLTDYYIGDLAEDSTSNSDSITIPKSITTNGDSLVTLNPKVWLSCPFIEKKIISPNTRIFRFALQSDKHSLDLPVGNHIFIRASINNQSVIRAYTPVTTSNDPPGYFDLLVKIYFKNEHPQFPDGGLMSQHLDSLNLGDKIDIKGPLGSFIYFGRGQYRIKSGSPIKNCKRIGMIAGGSGITPMYQVIQSVLNDPEDLTELTLIYANRTEQDILLRNELDDLVKHNSRFKIYHTLSKPSNSWEFGTGYVTEEIIRNNVSSSSSQTIMLLCGPSPMLESCIPNLSKIGFLEDEIIKF